MSSLSHKARLEREHRCRSGVSRGGGGGCGVVELGPPR